MSDEQDDPELAFWAPADGALPEGDTHLISEAGVTLVTVEWNADGTMTVRSRRGDEGERTDD